jgi:cell division transport system permease protein
MIARLGYFVRETAINIRRNVTLTLAAVLTVGFTVLMVGGALLVRDAVNNATQRFDDGVEFVVFLDPDISGAQADSIGQELGAHPDVARVTYFDKNKAYEEFVSFFPDFADTVDPDRLPASWRVVPREASSEVIASLTGQFEIRPGVFEVVSAQESIKVMRDFSASINSFLLWLALGMACASVLLVYNSIRVAMFARRREIEVMKLVGASNSFIRMPFILEGIMHGVFGGVVGVTALAFLRPRAEELFASLEGEAFFGDLAINGSQFQATALVVVLVALALGTLGSAFAAGRFLDV